jgi:hypothetical protein
MRKNNLKQQRQIKHDITCNYITYCKFLFVPPCSCVKINYCVANAQRRYFWCNIFLLVVRWSALECTAVRWRALKTHLATTSSALQHTAAHSSALPAGKVTPKISPQYILCTVNQHLASNCIKNLITPCTVLYEEHSHVSNTCNISTLYLYWCECTFLDY